MTVVAHVTRCTCPCHVQHTDTSWKYGVDSRDHVACVMACDSCRRNHERVLYDDDPPSRPLPPNPFPADATGTTEDGD